MAILENISINVHEADFDVAGLQRGLLSGLSAEGAVATFTGYVRRANDDRQVSTLELEHYPGMTEKKLSEIEAEANQRWPLAASLIIHRYGTLAPGDQIVLVACASAHRQAAFDACQFLMDWLKTDAPFWKLEDTDTGGVWVEARDSDDAAAAHWSKDPSDAA